ncbi:MAG: ABC transporter ATP-binding protein [Telmatospirillum sp.]|nr:ABC transporter ATP-binding protein [Telmatospirillum sp.]
MLTIRDLRSGYGHIEALHGIDMEVSEGQIVTLIGANGAGKTTLLMTICGSPRARTGRIVLNDRDITRMPTHEIVRLGLAHAPEGRHIFARMTVFENLQMGAVTTPPRYFAGDLERVLTLFPRLHERLDQRGGTLSGGEQQMLAIGRALMSRPRLLMLDEPSLGLAPLVVRQIFQIIREINREQGVTVFLVEQNAYHALKLAHRGYVMVNGCITLSGTGEALLADPAVRAAYLEGCTPTGDAAATGAEQDNVTGDRSRHPTGVGPSVAARASATGFSQRDRG